MEDELEIYEHFAQCVQNFRYNPNWCCFLAYLVLNLKFALFYFTLSFWNERLNYITTTIKSCCYIMFLILLMNVKECYFGKIFSNVHVAGISAWDFRIGSAQVPTLLLIKYVSICIFPSWYEHALMENSTFFLHHKEC